MRTIIHSTLGINKHAICELRGRMSCIGSFPLHRLMGNVVNCVEPVNRIGRTRFNIKTTITILLFLAFPVSLAKVSMGAGKRESGKSNRVVAYMK